MQKAKKRKKEKAKETVLFKCVGPVWCHILSELGASLVRYFGISVCVAIVVVTQASLLTVQNFQFNVVVCFRFARNLRGRSSHRMAFSIPRGTQEANQVAATTETDQVAAPTGADQIAAGEGAATPMADQSAAIPVADQVAATTQAVPRICHRYGIYVDVCLALEALEADILGATTGADQIAATTGANQVAATTGAYQSAANTGADQVRRNQQAIQSISSDSSSDGVNVASQAIVDNYVEGLLAQTIQILEVPKRYRWRASTAYAARVLARMGETTRSE